MSINELYKKRERFLQSSSKNVPVKWKVSCFLNELVELMFPIMSDAQCRESEKDIKHVKEALTAILNSYDSGIEDRYRVADKFIEALPSIHDALLKDADAICEGDPAATVVDEVIVSYPGFYATLVYRLAHALHKLGVPVVPRMMSEMSHSKTGIDIHPAAEIGESFCIDHGTGVVIGETTQIGDSVKIYQGVTLGAVSVNKEDAGAKRHPTIEDNVIIYSGATILGGKTKIGHHSVIGGNVWLMRSIKPYSYVVNRSEVRMRNNQSSQPGLKEPEE